MTRDVEQVDQSDMALSRRDLMGSSAVVAAGALGVGMVGTGMAQESPTDEISGTVEDTDGNAVEGATVVAVPHDESLDALVTTTDANGEYIFETSDLHPNSNLYHVVARDGTEADPFRSQQNYPFIAAEGEMGAPESGVARWTFDDADTSGSTAIDVWGDNDGTISGATTGATGQYNEAYDFDGTDDIVTADVVDYSAGDDFTVSLWINGPSSSSFTNPFDAQGSGGAGADEFILQKTDSDTGRLLAYVAGSNVANIDSGVVVGDENWHHIVGVWDGTGQTVYIYVDGPEENSTSISTTDSFIQSSKWNFGAREGNSSNFDGRIDDPRVYDKALSSTEVSDLYDTGSIQ